jgi:hypothetical protein
MAVGGNTLTLKGGVAGGGSISSAAGGTVQYAQGSPGQNVLVGSYGNLAFSDFAKTLPPAGTLGIAAAFTPGSGTGHVTTGSTVDFNGGSQNIPAFPYASLALSGSGTKTGAGSLAITGNLTTAAGVLFTGVTALSLGGTSNANAGTIIADTIAVGPGATLANSGTITAGSVLTGSGACTQTSTGILTLGGGVDIAGFNASAAGNAVNYTGPGQTIRSTTYHHLSVSGAGSRTLAGVTGVNGNLTLAGTVVVTATSPLKIGGAMTIGAGTSFDAGSFSDSLGGNWTNAGTLVAGNGTLSCNGTGAQTLSGPVLSGLGISNAAGVSLLTDETVAGVLTLTTGPQIGRAHV